MSSVTFDTLKFVEKLKAAGMPDAQAKAVAEAHSEALSESVVNVLATKSDIAELKLDMIKWIVGVGMAQLALLIGIFTRLP